jgi:micrococcal nuclease
MSSFFSLVFLVSLALFVVGLFKPGLVVRWGAKRSRRQASLIYGGAAIVSFILVGVLAPAESTASPPPSGTAASHGALAPPGPNGSNSKPGQSSQVLQASAGTSATAVVSQSSTTSTSSKSAGPKGLIPVVVTRDVDGDTIHVRMPNGRDETIRMLLIDTPETVHPDMPVEPFGPEASNFAKKELPVGKHIYIEEGVSGHERDKYGRLLAYVYISPTDMYNEDVVKRGLARVAYVYPPNTKHLTELERDQSYAKVHHLGIWSISGYVTPWGFDVNAAKARGSNHSGRSSSSPATSTGSASLKIVASHLTVYPGDYASVTVQTKPGAIGTIEVVYKSGPSKAKGLDPTTADPSGRITWTWKVGTNTSRGDWPITITVGSQVVHTTIHVL